MKTGLVFLVSVCMYAAAANSLGANKTNREVVVNQLCQNSGANTLREITSQLKKELETLKKEHAQQLIKMNKGNGGISKWNKSRLKKEFETLKKELTQQLIKMNKKDNEMEQIAPALNYSFSPSFILVFFFRCADLADARQ